MKLLRNGVLVAEGKASRDLDSGIIGFDVKTWHARDSDTDGWLQTATWTIDDGTRATNYVGESLGVGCYRDEIRSLDIGARDPLGTYVSIDVR